MKKIFFINTYGSLYSINKNNYKLNWFLNLDQTVDMNLNNLFLEVHWFVMKIKYLFLLMKIFIL